MNADSPANQATDTRKALLVFLGLLSSLPGLCLTVYAPALPELAVYFDTTDIAIRSSQTWFAITNAAVQILFIFVYTPIANRYGRKYLTIFGLVIFTLGSAGCTLANGMNHYIFWKIIQGLGTCVGPVVARSIIEDEFDDTQRRHAHRALWIGIITFPAIALFVSSIFLRYAGITSISLLLALIGLSMSIFAHQRLTNTGAPDVSGKNTVQPNNLDCLKKLLNNRSFMFPSLTVGFSLAGAFAYLTDIVFVFDHTLGMATGVDVWLTLNTATLAAVFYWDSTLANRMSQEARNMLTYRALLARWVVTLILVLMAYTGRAEPWPILILLLIYHLSIGLIVGDLQSDAMRADDKLQNTASSLYGALLNSGVLLGTALPLLPLAPDFTRMATTIFVCATLAYMVLWKSQKGRRSESA